MRQFILGAAVLLFSASAVPDLLAQAAPAGKQATPAGKSGINVEKGKQIYDTQKCSMCHKPNATGSLDGVGSRLGREDLRQWMLTPQVMAEKAKSTRTPKMPAYTKLSQEELDALLDYLQSMKKK